MLLQTKIINKKFYSEEMNMKNLFYITERKLYSQIRKGAIFTENFSDVYDKASDGKKDIYVFSCDGELFKRTFSNQGGNNYKLECHIKINCCKKIIVI